MGCYDRFIAWCLVFQPQVVPVYTAAVKFISTCIADTCTLAILGVHLAKLLKRSKETPVTRVDIIPHMPRTVDFPWVGPRAR